MPTRRRKAVRRCSRRWKPSSEPQNPFVLSLSKDRSSHPTGQEKISPSTSSGRTEIIMADSGIEQIMRLAPVIPVIVIDRVEDAVPMAEALVDRKSVVEGKSVSDRVDLGGPRLINKKKEKET